MPIPALVINMAQSDHRWAVFAARAAEVGQRVIRVEAVDGNALALDDRPGLDVRQFKLCHGRTPLAAEYGCYMSHLKALGQFVAMDIPHAVILEDDAGMPDDFVSRIAAMAGMATDGVASGIVKLFNFRANGFVRHSTTSMGDDLGQCIHGPLGSAMGYLVDRQSAIRLVDGLLPMFLPYDIALERAWSHGGKFAVVRNNLLIPLATASRSTLTRPGQSYKSSKLPLLMRTPTAIFRGVDYARRMFSALFRQ